MKANLFLVYVFLAAASAGFCDNPPIFQIRLVIPAASGSPAPVNCDKMTLRKLNRTTGTTSLELFYIERNVLLDQNDLKTTRVIAGQSFGQPVVDLTFTDQGRQRFAEITRDNIDRRSAIIVNGHLYSAPVIRTEIPSGQAEISSDFTHSEAEDLSNRINEALNR